MDIKPGPGEDAEEERRFPASRLRRRGEGAGAAPGAGPRPGGSLFAPRSVAGGRVQVFGCSPGFLLISLGVSIFLTILLNLLL
jgi:hypothetical protein